MLHIPALWYFDIKAIYLQGCCRVKFVIIPPGFVMQQYLWNIAIQPEVGCNNVWANTHCSGCSPLGGKSLWNKAILSVKMSTVKKVTWKMAVSFGGLNKLTYSFANLRFTFPVKSFHYVKSSTDWQHQAGVTVFSLPFNLPLIIWTLGSSESLTCHTGWHRSWQIPEVCKPRAGPWVTLVNICAKQKN